MPDPIIETLRDRARHPRATTDTARFPQKASAPLDDPSISRAETTIGFALPPLLRDAYHLVGDGGFGPGYGLLSLLPGGKSSEESVVELFLAFRSTDPNDAAWVWPSHLLPFCDWGCAIRSCIDCSTSEGAVLTFDPNVRTVGDPMSSVLAETHSSLRAWFSDWIAGVDLWQVMFEPDPARATTIENPFTGEAIASVPTRLRR